MGQGALACECREGDEHIQGLLASIHDETAALACIAERAFMSRLEGGCSTPIAVRTRLCPGGVAGTKGEAAGRSRKMCLDAAVLSLDGVRCVEGRLGTYLPTGLPLPSAAAATEACCAKRPRLDDECAKLCTDLEDEVSEVSLPLANTT